MNMRIIVGVLGLVSLFAAGGANAATVSLSPSATTANVGETFGLTVGGTDFFTDVSSGSISLTWDASVLQLDSTLAEITASVAANGFPIDFGVNSLTPGQLDITAATFGTVLGPTFDFFSLAFTVIQAPLVNPSDVSIFSGALGAWQDGLGQELAVAYNSATVTVSAVPIPAAVWLLGSGLLGLVGVARRRSAAES